MKGDNLLPTAPKNLSGKIKKLWKLHFSKRYDFEKKYFGENHQDILFSIKNISMFDDYIDKNFSKYLKKNKFNLCFISGIKILPQKILNLLPSFSINFHLGFIPYYKGTITTFWPFYFLEPHMLGTTYHIIDTKVDTGEILHTSFPNLSKNDSLHESSCKAITKGQSEIKKIYDYCKKRIRNNQNVIKDPNLIVQGKNFQNKDWKPEMLSFIYDIHKDEIVKNFYRKELLDNVSHLYINDNLVKKKS